MTLFMIGLGLWDSLDISLKGLDTAKKCDHIYLENYTSRLSCPITKLESLFGKKVILANRDMVEVHAELILEHAKNENVAFLVIGDVFGATTHTDLKLRAVKEGITVKVIHNASVLTAVGDSGLELYKFGKVTSIPFENEDVKSPLEVLEMNQKNGLHTLFLLDLRPDEERFMTIKEASEYLLNHIEDCNALGCAGLGSGEPEIVYAELSILKEKKFEKFPQCLIIPGNLHFIEEDSLKCYS